MSDYVVDASVAVKWYLTETDTDKAERLIKDQHNLIAPDLLYPEVGNVLLKRARRGDLTVSDAADALVRLETVSVTIHGCRPLVSQALDVADQAGISVYDALYVALAVREGCPLVTADERLFNALKSGPLSAHIELVASLP